MLQHFKVFHMQLCGYRGLKKTPEERAYLEADITGYELVMESESEANANNFMITKHKLKDTNPKINNTQVVEYMKENGLWEKNGNGTN